MLTDNTELLTLLDLKYPARCVFTKGSGQTKTLQIPRELFGANNCIKFYIESWLRTVIDRSIFRDDFVIFYPIDSVHFCNETSRGVYLLEEGGELFAEINYTVKEFPFKSKGEE